MLGHKISDEIELFVSNVCFASLSAISAKFRDWAQLGQATFGGCGGLWSLTPHQAPWTQTCG